MQSKEEISNIKEEFKPFRTALTDLLSMSKSAAQRLEHCVKSATTDKEKECKTAGAAQTKKIGRPGKAVSEKLAKNAAIEWAMSTFKAVSCSVLGSDGKVELPSGGLNLKLPLIIRIPNFSGTEFKSLVDHMGGVLQKFKGSPEHAEPGRTHKKLPDVISKPLSDFLLLLLPDEHIVDQYKMNEALIKDLTMTCFGVASEK